MGTRRGDVEVRAPPARSRDARRPRRNRASAACPAAASRAPSSSWPPRVVTAAQPVLQRYGVSDDDAFAVGLTCGGIIDVFVEPISAATFPDLDEVADDIRAGRPVAVATVVDLAWTASASHLVHPAGFRVEQPGRERGSTPRVRDDARGLLDAGPDRDHCTTAPTENAGSTTSACSSPPTRLARE